MDNHGRIALTGQSGEDAQDAFDIKTRNGESGLVSQKVSLDTLERTRQPGHETKKKRLDKATGEPLTRVLGAGQLRQESQYTTAGTE
jgi:hypothetical protein